MLRLTLEGQVGDFLAFLTSPAHMLRLFVCRSKTLRSISSQRRTATVQTPRTRQDGVEVQSRCLTTAQVQKFKEYTERDRKAAMTIDTQMKRLLRLQVLLS